MGNFIKDAIVGTGIGGVAGLLGSAAIPPASVVMVPGGMILGGGLGVCNSLITGVTTTAAKTTSYASLLLLTGIGSYISKSYLSSYRNANCDIFATDGACYVELANGIFYSVLTAQLFNAAQAITIRAAEHFFPPPNMHPSVDLSTIAVVTVYSGLGLLTLAAAPVAGGIAIGSGFLMAIFS
ncbi:hypothetical protein LCGC14_2194480 [marine sediment metagenome]|uniref:Uncharacterized protein n=1 Tax=marine sediment metagenome TaxID=412755 RepID=A0A0F9FVZ0_9ZZZZ